MRVGIYARVSTEDQTCALQLMQCREYVRNRAAQGWQIVGEYVDTGWSGVDARRPQLHKLLNDAKMKRLDCVVCWKIDRFGRSVRAFIGYIQELDKWGVRFITTAQEIDTDRNTATSRLMMHIFIAFAEFERSMISERVKAGIKAHRVKGKPWGKAPLIVDRQKLRELRLLGHSYPQIAKIMNISQSSAYKYANLTTTSERAAVERAS